MFNDPIIGLEVNFFIHFRLFWSPDLVKVCCKRINSNDSFSMDLSHQDLISRRIMERKLYSRVLFLLQLFKFVFTETVACCLEVSCVNPRLRKGARSSFIEEYCFTMKSIAYEPQRGQQPESIRTLE